MVILRGGAFSYERGTPVDQIEQSQISDPPWQPSLLGGSFEVNLKGMAVKVNLRSEIGRFGLQGYLTYKKTHPPRTLP